MGAGMKPWRAWTVKEDKILIYYYGIRRAKEIAVALNRTERAINSRAHKLGLKSQSGKFIRQKHNRVHIKHMIMDRGMSAREIGDEIGTNQRNIRWIAKNEFSEYVNECLRENGRRSFRDHYGKRLSEQRTENCGQDYAEEG